LLIKEIEIDDLNRWTLNAEMEDLINDSRVFGSLVGKSSKKDKSLTSNDNQAILHSNVKVTFH